MSENWRNVVELRGRHLRYSHCTDLEASGTATTTRPAGRQPSNSSVDRRRSPPHLPPQGSRPHPVPVQPNEKPRPASRTTTTTVVPTIPTVSIAAGGTCSRSLITAAYDGDGNDDESSLEGAGPWTIPQFSKEEKLRRSAVVTTRSVAGGEGGESFEMVALSCSPKGRVLSSALAATAVDQRYDETESDEETNERSNEHNEMQRLDGDTDNRLVSKAVGVIGGRRMYVSHYRPDSALSSFSEPGGNNADNGIEKSVLGTAFQFLYRMGYSIFNPNNVLPVDDDQNVDLVGSQDLVTGSMVIGKIRFWAVSLLVFLQAGDSIKYAILNQAEKGVMYLYMSLLCLVVKGCVNVMFITLFGLLWGDIVRFLVEYVKLLKTYLEPTWARSLSIFICVVAVMLSLLLTGIGTFKIQWTPKAAILQRSYDLALSFLVWSQSKANNKSLLAQLVLTYGMHVTPLNIFLGILGFFMDISGFMSSYVCLFVMFSISLSLYIMISVFEKTLPLGNWRFLLDIQKFCAMANSTFGTFFLGTHLDNLFTFAYFLLALFEMDIFTTKFAYRCLNVMFIGVTYWLSAKVANKYDRISTVTLDHFLDHERIWVDGREVKVLPFLKQIKANKVGIGKGQFRVTYKFVGKFLCAVGTFFLFLLEHKLQMLQSLFKKDT